MSNTYAQLSLGANNDQNTVRRLQELLNEKHNAGLQVDGIFGSKTDKAVRDYQSAKGLQVDGIVGPKTWGALLQTDAAATTPAPAISTPADQAKQALEEHTANAPGDFSFMDQALLDMADKAIRERGNFTYDPNSDAMYRQYVQQYMTQGKQAMEDTMGIAQAMTGGYGSSYAQTAGQQAYQSHLQGLSDVLPQLYQLAYEKYNDETDQLRENYDRLAQKRQDAYDAHQAQQEAYEDRKQELYEVYQDTLQRQDKAYTKLAALLKLGYNPTDEDLAAAGMTRAMANIIAQGG